MTASTSDSAAPMTDIHDIKPVLAFGAQWPWWVWLIIVLSLATLAALIFWLRRRRRRADETSTTEPALPPDVAAFQELDRLAAKGSDNPKQYYFSLSAILRRYVERRYDFPAAEMTTEELLPQIQLLDLPGALANEVKQFCRSSDPIKFADAGASQASMSKDLAFVHHFVELTTASVIEKEEGDDPTSSDSSTTAPKQLPHQNPIPGKSPLGNAPTHGDEHETRTARH